VYGCLLFLQSGWGDLNSRPLDPQTGSGGFGDLVNQPDLPSDLGFCCSLSFIVFHSPADFSRTLGSGAVPDSDRTPPSGAWHGTRCVAAPGAPAPSVRQHDGRHGGCSPPAETGAHEVPLCASGPLGRYGAYWVICVATRVVSVVVGRVGQRKRTRRGQRYLPWCSRSAGRRGNRRSRA
jgi:hypothetical protein